MATELPVPIEFRLPEGWKPAVPDDVGAPGAAFVALHPGPDDGFTANITIDGEPDAEETSLEQRADRSLAALRGAGMTVEMVNRERIGSPAAPGLTQVLTLSGPVNGVVRELVQSQVYLSLVDSRDSRAQAMIHLALTSTAAQFEQVLPDFQYFVWTVRPDTTPS